MHHSRLLCQTVTYLDDYVQGRISASDRRIVFTKWVGKAWEEISDKKEMIIRSFKKCGISIDVDGSEDDQVNIEGLEVGESDEEATDNNADPFKGVEDSNYL